MPRCSHLTHPHPHPHQTSTYSILTRLFENKVVPWPLGLPLHHALVLTNSFGYGCDLDGSLDSGLTGQLMPYVGICHRVKDGANLWKTHVNRESFVFNPVVSRDTLW